MMVNFVFLCRDSAEFEQAHSALATPSVVVVDTQKPRSLKKSFFNIQP